MAKKSDRNNDVAAKNVTQIKKALDGVITNMVKDPSKFVVAPDKDFTRNRTLTFKKMLHIILGMGGASLQKELHDYFEDNTGFATKSAFVQQRGKIRPEAFKHLLHQFNKSCNDTKTYMGSHLYACDGTVVTVAANPADEETHIKGSKNAVGDN